jgi:hypothetical protein
MEEMKYQAIRYELPQGLFCQCVPHLEGCYFKAGEVHDVDLNVSLKVWQNLPEELMGGLFREWEIDKGFFLGELSQ